MSERCDICGIAALESERFAEESIPFRPKKKYCPACRQILYRRVFAVITVVPLVAACAAVFGALHRHANPLDSATVQWSLLLIFQWLMILPHELGHAAAGRALGFTQIRILIGSGKPLFSFRLFGIPTLVNLIPFGGVTLSKPTRAVSRWKYFGLVAAGLLVNLAAAVVAWGFIAPGNLFSLHSGSPATPFFWANILVLAENLFPHQILTPLGPLNSDGLQLFNVLFRGNKPLNTEPARLSTWALAIRHLVKWMGFLVMISVMLIFIWIGALPFLNRSSASGWELVALPAIMFSLALATCWVAVRIAREPISSITSPRHSAGTRQSPMLTPKESELVQQAIVRAKQHDFATAETLVDQTIAGIRESSAAGWPLSLTLLKLEFIVSQNDIERAEKVCFECVNRATTTEEKIKFLDGLASFILYTAAPAFLEHAERLVRQALELAPGSLTLKGSFGGILVEQGRFAEAEPLLRECLDRSPALHDQGISAFYLGVAKLNAGERSEAQRLIERSIILHPEPWLLAKAEARLKELNG